MKNYRKIFFRKNHYHIKITKESISAYLSPTLKQEIEKNRLINSFPHKIIRGFLCSIIGALSVKWINVKEIYMPGDSQDERAVNLSYCNNQEKIIIKKGLTWACQIYDSIIDNIEEHNKN